MKEVRYNGDLIKALQETNNENKRDLRMYVLKSGIAFVLPYALTFLGSNVGTDKFKMFSLAGYTILCDPLCTLGMLGVAGIVAFKQEMDYRNGKIEESEELEQLKSNLDIKKVIAVNEFNKSYGHNSTSISGALIDVESGKKKKTLLALKNLVNEYKIYIPENNEDMNKIKEYKLLK